MLDLQLDTGMSPVIDYFEIFLERMLLWSVIVLDIAIWLIRLALHDPLIF